MAKTIEEHNNFGIDATIIADSKNEFGQRLTTYVVTFPRYILAEVNTHRMFSRNSASSRAVPFKTMVERVKNHPFIPIAWQRDHRGMQGTEYISSPDEIEPRINDWLDARNDAVKRASYLSEMGVTKQLCNRLLEPFMWHTAIITATEWENFFKLRCPEYKFNDKVYRSKKDCIRDIVKDVPHTSEQISFMNQSNLKWFQLNEGQGEIHIMALAEAMWDAMNESEPNQLKAGEWHIPFGNQFDENKLIKLHYNLVGKEGRDHNDEEVDLTDLLIKIATARCARISYLNFEGKDDYLADIMLHDNLLKYEHMSPFEHCGRAMTGEEYDSHVSGQLDVENAYNELQVGHVVEYTATTTKNIHGWSGNFRGFIQYRKMVE